MAPALTCVLLAQLAAAPILRPVPPQGVFAPPGKRLAAIPPDHAIQVRALQLAPGPAPRAGVTCPVRMRTADPALDPGMVGGPGDPAAAAALDPHMAVNGNCAVNVDAEAFKRK